MWLKVVVSLIGKFIFDREALHLRLTCEELLGKDLSEVGMHIIVHLYRLGHVLGQVNLGALVGLSVGTNAL